MCPNIGSLITFSQISSVFFASSVRFNTRSQHHKHHLFHHAFFFFCHHSILCLSFFLSLPLIILLLMAAANLCSDCQKNESVLSAWKIIFFARPPLTCYHVKVQRERGGKTQSVHGGGEAGMVSVSERGLGPGQSHVHRRCRGKVGRMGHTLVSHRLGIFLFFFFLPPFLHFLFFPCSLSPSYSLYLPVSPAPSLRPIPSTHLWPTCEFIGQLSDNFRSILFNSFPVDVRGMSYLPQLRSQYCYCCLLDG